MDKTLDSKFRKNIDSAYQHYGGATYALNRCFYENCLKNLNEVSKALEEANRAIKEIIDFYDLDRR